MARYIVYDVETPNHRNDRISAIGITVVEGRQIVDSFFTLVNPEARFDDFNIQLTGITPEMVREAPSFPQLWARIEPILSSGIPVAHNAVFDLGVLKKCLYDYGIFWKERTPYLCTVQMGRRLLPGMSHKLNVLSDYYGISLDHHQADSDSRACAEILLRYMARENNLDSFLGEFYIGKPHQIRQKFPGASVFPAAQNPSQAPGIPKAGADLSDALRLLSDVYGFQSFRPGQDRIIQNVLEKRDVLALMPTGSGKSVCYQIPALLFPGTTLVISPLIALIKNQVASLKSRGISAACLDSTMTRAELNATMRQAAQGAYKLLYVAPERLKSPDFLQLCERMNIPFVAVDEAHCVSQWGHDFRPSYLKIADFIARLPARPVVGAYTATATPRTREDIQQFLNLQNPFYLCTGFNRPNLSFSVYTPGDKDFALLGLLRDRFRQSGIIYCSSRKAVEAVCEDLCAEGFPATRYHAKLTPEERNQNQEDFLFDRKRIMVATNAFGLGIDKSNVSYVIHYNMPKSLEAYYQEAGRAGRDGCDADCILLYSPEDVALCRYLIENTEPNPDLTPEEQQSVREKDEERLKLMTFYARSRRCLRHEILRYFGEASPIQCDNCSNCVPDCEHVDITTEAQMILSCVARTEQKLPRESIMELLLGQEPEDLPEGMAAQSLTTFGLMKDTAPQLLLEEIQALCDQGILDLWEEDIRVLRLNQRSRDVLFRKGRVTMRKSLRHAPGKRNAKAEDLFQALQRLRYDISGREHIAASTLFPDATLQEICRELPRDKAQLAKIDGMGIFRANKYGDEMLPLINRYAPVAKPAANATKKTVRKPQKKTVTVPAKNISYRDMVIAEGKMDVYQPWTAEEDAQLKQEFLENMPLLEMAARHRRTRGAILSRLKKLDIV